MCVCVSVCFCAWIRKRHCLFKHIIQLNIEFFFDKYSSILLAELWISNCGESTNFVVYQFRRQFSKTFELANRECYTVETQLNCVMSWHISWRTGGRTDGVRTNGRTYIRPHYAMTLDSSTPFQWCKTLDWSIRRFFMRSAAGNWDLQKSDDW